MTFNAPKSNEISSSNDLLNSNGSPNPNDSSKSENLSGSNEQPDSNDLPDSNDQPVSDIMPNPDDLSGSDDPMSSEDPTSSGGLPNSKGLPGSNGLPNSNLPPQSANPPNTNGPTNPRQLLNDKDSRCRVCGHNRTKCAICRPRRSCHRAWDRTKAKYVIKARGKRYCCKCSQGKKLSRHPNLGDKERLKLIEFAGLKSADATQLRSYLHALESKQVFNPPQLCGQLDSMGLTNFDGISVARTAPLAVMNCRIPNNNNPYTTNNGALELHSLSLNVQLVYNNTNRLILLLLNDTPIDAGILSSSLRTIFNQLAFLNHRAFPVLAPAILPNRKVFQHSLGVARRRVQAAYKALYATARRAGVLRSSNWMARAGGFHVLDAELSRVRVVADQRLLWSARELADELGFLLGLLTAARSL